MYNIKKSFHLCEPIYLSALSRCAIISMHDWLQSIYNSGKDTRIKFPKSYHFKLYWTVALKTSCKLGIVDCPLRQLFSHIKIKVSLHSVCPGPCVLGYLQVQKTYLSFKKFLIFSFKSNCGLIHVNILF